MKHQVYALLLCMSFSLYANSDNHIADKSKRIGRFSYEDSFDESLVENILKHAPSAVKKNIKRLLYPTDDENIPQRLLLLGGKSNATTTAVAKTMAVRGGYEYYVIDAAALLREYREGRQMLLSEVRPIIKSGKPLALIITELPEMADYSGLLASTLWLLIDQAAQYPDVLVIATSAFEKGQLSEDIKERFCENIVPVVLNKDMQEHIESVVVPKSSWFERNKLVCCIIGGFVGTALMAAAQLYAQILFIEAYKKREKEVMFFEEAIAAGCNAILLQGKEQQYMQKQQLVKQEEQNNIQKEQLNIQNQQLKKQTEQYDLQNQQLEKQKEQYNMQKEQYVTQLDQYVTQINTHDNLRWLYWSFMNGNFSSPTEEKQKARDSLDQANGMLRENAIKKKNSIKI